MKITFLGTGSADWKMQEHRHLPGFRRNSSTLIDDVLLIDPGVCVPDALETFGKSPDAIRYIINTHRHSDHYNADTVARLSGAAFYEIAPGETCCIGKYKITALRANHSRPCVHFLISDGEKTLFYGLDGAWLLYEEIDAIKQGVDLAVLDATLGASIGDYRIFEHNNLNMITEMKLSLSAWVKQFYITHISRNLNYPHEELVERMTPHGIAVAYDGLEIEI